MRNALEIEEAPRAQDDNHLRDDSKIETDEQGFTADFEVMLTATISADSSLVPAAPLASAHGLELMDLPTPPPSSPPSAPIWALIPTPSACSCYTFWSIGWHG